MTYVVTPLYCQFDWSPITKADGCTWTSVANGIRATTGRAINPDRVHAKVKHTEETDPTKPGWSIPDAVKAVKRLELGVQLINRTGAGWAALVDAHDHGFAFILQGDSDRFPDGTCSGAFNGDHCVMGHPQEDARGWWLTYDSICKTYRYEDPKVIRAYGEKLGGAGLRFAVFSARVPNTVKPVHGTLRARAGQYATYKTVNGQAVRVGTLTTGGWPGAEAVAFSAIQVDGTGRTSLVKLLEGSHEGTVLYRKAKGLRYTTS